MSTSISSSPEPVTLNEFGHAIWRHKYSKTLFVERTYDWRDRVVVIDEVGGHRRIVDDIEFSTFNFSDWIPVTVEEYKKIKMFYKEIYN